MIRDEGFRSSQNLTLERCLQYIPKELTNFSETAILDVQVLLAEILGVNRSWVLAHPEYILTHDQRRQLDSAIRRLIRGEPLPYVLGHWEFYGLDLKVSPAVLIPRPETELLVDRVVGWLQANPNRRFGVDVGTGSGCIPIALIKNVPDLRMLASEVSIDAIKIARENFLKHDVDKRVFLVQMDLLSAIQQKSTPTHSIDFICANLPYIPTEKLGELVVSRSEPKRALDGGPNGLKFIQGILDGVVEQLNNGGCIFLEIGSDQGKAVQTLALSTFSNADVKIIKDLAGLDRLVIIEIN